jgi:TP901 family phage tail tape measure protein
VKNYEWVLNLVDKVSGPMQNILQRGEKVSNMLDKAKSSAKSMFLNMAVAGQVAQGFQTVSNSINQAVEPGVRFEATLAEVSALTGVTGSKLDAMGESGRRMAGVFGGPVTGYLTSAKSIMGELGPQMAQNQAAMDSMTTSVAILSKSMDGDAAGATKALTTSLQQFNVDLTNPVTSAKAMTTAMNVMAAAANAGAAEVPDISAALKVAGVAASGARVSFYETNAAIQVLAQGGLKGAEAGTALRNVLGKLGEGRFLPKDVQAELKGAGVDIAVLTNKSLSFGQRLNELKKIQGDTALTTKLFGTENASAAGILLRGTGAMANYQKAITGTNAATDAAKIIMNTTAGRMERMRANWENLGITAFQATKQYLPYIQTGGQVAVVISQAVPALEAVKIGMVHAGSAVWDFGLNMLKGAQSVLIFGAKMVLVAVQSIGQFILSVLRGQFSLVGFVVSMGQSAAATLRAGAAWLWAGLTGMPALVAGFVRATVAQWALNVAMNANPIGAIILGIIALAGAVYLIIRNWDVVKGWLLNLGAFMVKFNPFSLMVQGIFKLFPGVELWFKGLWDRVTGFIQQLLSKVKWLWDKIAPYLGFGDMKIGGDIGAKLIMGGKDEDPFAASKTNIGAAGNSKVKSSVDKVASGGSKPQNIYINIGKFQDQIVINTTSVKEGAKDMVASLEEALVRVVNGVSQATGN